MKYDIKWLINISNYYFIYHAVNSVTRDAFSEFVKEALDNRVETYTKEKNIKMNVKLEFSELFRN